MAQLVKNPPAMQETWIQSLGREDPLEKGKAIHSSILAWRIPRTVYNPWGHKKSDTTEQLSLHSSSNTGNCFVYTENLLFTVPPSLIVLARSSG